MTAHNHDHNHLAEEISFAEYDAYSTGGTSYSFVEKGRAPEGVKLLSEKEFDSLLKASEEVSEKINEEDPRIVAIRKLQKAGYNSIEEAVAASI